MARRTSHTLNPALFHGLIALCLQLFIILTFLFLGRFTPTGTAILVGWLIGANLVAFGYYGFDKARARQAARRVPEVVLYSLVIAGGSLGAFAAMQWFRHKTIKGAFQIVFWGIIALQVLLILFVAWCFWITRTGT